MSFRDQLVDLHKQATEDRSHYYVGSTLKRAIDVFDLYTRDLNKLQAELTVYREALEKARFELEMVSKHGGLNHRAIPHIDEALEAGRKIREGK